MTETTLKFPEVLPTQFVAFIDVLGFAELVKSSQTKKLETYFDIVTKVQNDMREGSSKIQSLNISDSIILIAPRGLSGLKQLLRAVRTIQRKLLYKGILMRGAITLGEVYFDENLNIVIGKGYIRAYLLEKEAKYPRVIIDPSILKELDTDRAGFTELFNNEERGISGSYIYHYPYSQNVPDDAIFVDYAYSVKPDHTTSDINRKVYDNIKKNLYSDQAIYTKYIWLRDYYIACLSYTSKMINDNRQKTNLENWIEKFKRL